MPLPNGCELSSPPRATSSEIAELAGAAPASCAAGFVYLRCDFNSFLFRPLPCMPNNQRNKHSLYN
jgi:hypothetical protein